MSTEQLVDVDGIQIPLSKLEKLYKRATRERVSFIPIKRNGKVTTIPLNKVEEILMQNKPQLIQLPKKKKPQEEVQETEEVESRKTHFQPEVTEELKEEPETVKMYRKAVLKPHEEREIVLSRGKNRVFSPSFSESVKERVRSVFEPIFSESRSDEIEYKTRYKPKLAYKRKTVFKPQDSFKYENDYDYEPSNTQIAIEDFAPKEESSIEYEPQVEQEAYPIFQYSTLGLPDTFIDNYAPEEIVRIKPVTDFEIRARPKPLIMSQAHLILLDKLMKEVL